MPANLFHAQIANPVARAREGDDFAAININGALPTAGKGVGLFRAEIHRLDFKQDARGGERRVAVPVGGMKGGHG